VRYFATGNLEQLAEGLAQIMEDSRLRQDLVRRGSQRASLFSWEETARTTAQAFRWAASADRPIRPESLAVERLLERLEGAAGLKG
jgi:hypothetical protein